MRILLAVIFLSSGASLDANILDFIYGKRVGCLMRPLITTRLFNELVGFGANCWLSKYVISFFVTNNKIDLKEAVRKKPADYHTFNDFFTRTLEDNARPICSEAASICSPADGTIYLIENVQESNEFIVKGMRFNLAKFLGNETVAKNYYGGTLLVIYLSPADYHRFHAPFESQVQAAPQRIKGNYESVNPCIFKWFQPLTENERQLLMLHSPHSVPVAFVAVGALCVGRISFTYQQLALSKGQEMGYFSFGGSTVVLLFPPHTMTRCPVLCNGQTIKMGECIGYFNISK